MESVVTGNAESVKKILERKPQYRECLFSRGYMITEDAALDETQYPFYGNWTRIQLNAQFTAFVHKDQDKHLYTQGDKAFFLVGHAYNPFNGVYREEELLRQCGAAYEKSREAFFDAVNEWTGIFAIYVLDGGEVIAAQDCAGVKAVYFGEINGKLCFLSHPQMAADIYGLQMDPFIEKLVSNRFYNIGNRYLPGNLSPFKELRRLGANLYLQCDSNRKFSVHRFYPTAPHAECKTDAEYEAAVQQAYEILHKNLELASEKWERPVISLSGGTDSKTTLACANGLYDKFGYFSFQSKDTEITDSLAAHEICEKIGVEHTIYPIPQQNEEFEDFDDLKALIVHSYGYVRGLADHEVRKHIYLYRLHDFDTEIKSWSSEIVRVFFERKYDLKMPETLTPRHFSIFQTRFFGSPALLHKTDKIYKDFMEEYDLKAPKFNFEHTDLYYWEVRMSSWGMLVSQSLDICHRVTFPFNNRKLIDLMFSMPREYRKSDKAHNDIIRVANKDIYDMGVHVKNNYFKSYRILLEKAYYRYRTMFYR